MFWKSKDDDYIEVPVHGDVVVHQDKDGDVVVLDVHELEKLIAEEEVERVKEGVENLGGYVESQNYANNTSHQIHACRSIGIRTR